MVLSQNGLSQNTLQELGAVLRDLHYGKAADADGMVAEMFKYSNIPLQTCLLDIYNSMIASGSFEMSWQHTLFSMLPKSGDSSQPTNWRPIAVSKITYKIFSRLLYNRLRVVMDEQQPHDQTGSSRVESSLYAKKMAGPIGHRREKEMKREQVAKYIHEI